MFHLRTAIGCEQCFKRKKNFNPSYIKAMKSLVLILHVNRTSAIATGSCAI